MGVVTKLKSGFIYESNFSGSLDSNWETSPNDPSRLQIEEGNLRLKSGGTPFYLFFASLTNEKEFVIDVKNIYNPTGDGVGGLIVYANQDDFIALEEYYDAEKGIVNTYPWIRVVRNHNTYSGYWSKDGKEWFLVGTHNFGNLTPKIGLFIDGEGEDLIVEYVRIFRSPYITVLNPPPSTHLKLVGEEGLLDAKVCLEHYPKLIFQVSRYGIPFEGKFVWDDSGNTIESEVLREIWGGDEFRFQISLDLYYTNKDNEFVRIDANQEEFLGYLNSLQSSLGTVEYRDIPITVRNPHQGNFKNVVISLVEYRGKDHYKRFAELSLDGKKFSKEIIIGDVLSNSDKVFYLRIKRATDLDTAVSEVYFGLNISSGFLLGGD